MIIFVHGLAGVLLKMSTGDPNGFAAAISEDNVDTATDDNGACQLRDLVALWQVRVKIIFPIKH